MSEEKIPVYTGKPEVNVETEVYGTPLLMSCCHRCGEGGKRETIGNGHYCQDCAEDIWENVT